jgi:hypothetical protein
MIENLKLSGKLSIVLFDSAGNIKDTREVNNLVVNSGLTFIASRMTGTAKSVMSHMAVGTSTTAVTATQTDIQSILGTRVALDIAGGSPSTSAVVYSASFNVGVSVGSITEAAIFNSGTLATGDMLCRTVFTAITKGATDSMVVSWTISLVAV